MIRRVPRWCALVQLLLASMVATAAYAQSTDHTSSGALYRTRTGFVDIARSSRYIRLTRYNDTLGSPRPEWLGNPLPIDLAIPPSVKFPPLLLVSVFGKAALYTAALDSTPPPRSFPMLPLWLGDIPAMQRIVEVGDFDGDGTLEALLVGDSSLAVIGLDGGGKPHFILPPSAIKREVIDALVTHTEPRHLLLIARNDEEISVVSVDLQTGASINEQTIPGGGGALVAMLGTTRGERVVVATTGTHPTAYIYDPRELFAPDTFHLSGTPIGMATLIEDGNRIPAVFFSRFPSPTLQRLLPGALPQTLDYPLRSIPEGVAERDGMIILYSSDSLALYDRSLRLRSLLGAVGAGPRRIIPIDSSRFILSSRHGSRLYRLPNDYSWLDRHWSDIALGGLGVLLAAGLVVALRRYRFVRTMYNNLVRDPGSQGVIVVSPSQRVRQINMSARSILDIDPYIPTGRHVTEYLGTAELAPLGAPLRRLLSQGEEFEQRIDVERDGALRALTLRGRPLRGNYGFTVGYLLLVEDVTRTLERERLVNWASVAHHIAHEMKTPLGTVMMTAEILHDKLSGSGSTGEFAKATNRIIRQAVRLRAIVDDLLTIARTESLQRVQVDLSLLLSSLLNDYHDTLPQSVTTRLELKGEDFRCMVDVNQLVAAMRNLVDNAWQAIGTREEGTISLTLQESPAMLTIIVEDNGTGMASGTLARLFQPFYTERRGGSGIGTVIIKRVFEAHGGNIEVKSDLGRGTRFILTLPRWETWRQTTPSSAPSRDPAP